jgi:hemerythrin-like metal-binding protein
VAGDRVLRGVADRVRESMRGSDSLTRWGGEEFIVLAPGTSLPDAHILAQRICEHVAQQDFAEVGRVTISIGVAEHLPSETFENWLNRVDQAMYESKQLGRNQVRSNIAGVPDHSAPEGEEERFVKLVWKSAFVSGNELIDEQHAHLFRISNDLLDAVLSRKPPYEISAAIDRLLDSIARHFEEEETILRELGFAKLTEHLEAHARLIAKGRDLAQAFRAGELSTGPLLQYLTYDLVAMHILCADREYFDLTLLNLRSSRA